MLPARGPARPPDRWSAPGSKRGVRDGLHRRCCESTSPGQWWPLLASCLPSSAPPLKSAQLRSGTFLIFVAFLEGREISRFLHRQHLHEREQLLWRLQVAGEQDLGDLLLEKVSGHARLDGEVSDQDHGHGSFQHLEETPAESLAADEEPGLPRVVEHLTSEAGDHRGQSAFAPLGGIDLPGDDYLTVAHMFDRGGDQQLASHHKHILLSTSTAQCLAGSLHLTRHQSYVFACGNGNRGSYFLHRKGKEP